jgi:hypothetical protein
MHAQPVTDVPLSTPVLDVLPIDVGQRHQSRDVGLIFRPVCAS